MGARNDDAASAAADLSPARAQSERITQQIAVKYKRESDLSDAQREVFSRMRLPCNGDGSLMYFKKVRYRITCEVTMSARGELPADGASSSSE